MANRHLDRVLSADYLNGLDEWPVEEIRSRRAECQRLEDAASYLRRLVQTRIDILGTELQIRTSDSDADMASLLASLPSILTDPSEQRNTTGRLVGDQLDEVQEQWAQRRVDAACAGVDIESAPDLDEAGLRELADRLTLLEHQISAERRKLHDIFDRLQAELVQRYKSGRASVEGILR